MFESRKRKALRHKIDDLEGRVECLIKNISDLRQICELMLSELDIRTDSKWCPDQGISETHELVAVIDYINYYIKRKKA